MFGEILGPSTHFDSVFPVEAIPSHADLGLEGGNSHSCLSDGAVSSAGRAHIGAERRAQRGPKVLILGMAFRHEAGVHVAGLELCPTFSSLGERPLTLFIINNLNLEKAFQPDKEKHLSVPSGPSAYVTSSPRTDSTHPSVLRGPALVSTADGIGVGPPTVS